MIRVGRRDYAYGKQKDPIFPDFKPIISLTKSTPYGCLGPYMLSDENGRILENIWQFSKVYQQVPRSRQIFSRYNPFVIWEHDEETHVDVDGNLTDAYFAWREKGMNAEYAIRYPVTYGHRHKCLYALKDGECTKLGYIEARKQIYLPLYLEMVKKEKKFLKLKQMLQKGTNILIIEVDGPHQESLEYYKERYNVDDDFITCRTMLATKESINIMLEDERHPFGHGYCLALALLQEIENKQ